MEGGGGVVANLDKTSVTQKKEKGGDKEENTDIFMCGRWPD